MLEQLVSEVKKTLLSIETSEITYQSARSNVS